jgi:membrane protein implicated in regulation of membrane protease activity
MLTIAWIAVGVVLIGVEVHHLAFYALFGAAGCFAAAVVAAAAPDAILLQVLAAVVVAVLGIVLLRPAVSQAVTQRRGGVRTAGVHGGLVGQEVITLDTVGDPGAIGHVRLAGESWRAVSGNDHPIPAGTRVLVTAVQGTTLVVWPADGHFPPLAADGSAEDENGEQEHS